MSWTVGIDTGGTFTDVFAANTATGEIRHAKRPSTPDDPSRAILLAVEALKRDQDVDLASLNHLAHGTTVGTNALIQRRGGAVAVVTTKGFRDLLEIGRQTRPRIFDLQTDAPAPLAAREVRFEVDERVLADGSVHRPLSPDDLDGLADAIRSAGVEVCAVCFLFSFLNPAHETAVRDGLRERLPDVRFSVSAEVQPEFREFERLNTTVVNAYLQPVMERYIDRLADGLQRLAPSARVGVNQSSGGLMGTDLARAFPVRTALSGPAAGVVGAVHAAHQVGRPDVMTIDVGGTSADVAMIRNYAPSLAREREVAGFPIRLPMIDIDTIGAGGGSIAWFDRDGLLKVGPSSAGAVPGPACYGLGGTEPTVTDANLVLGRLGTELVDGGLSMDRALAVDALRPIADRLGWTVERAALSVLEIVVSNMVRALRTLSVEKGYDPADFVLMPFGGAGPLHAREIATELGMSEIIVPAAPGIVCAHGLLVAETREDFVRSRRVPVTEEAMIEVAAYIAELDRGVDAWLDGFPEAIGAARRELTVDARYVGQNFELQVPLGRVPHGDPLTVPSAEAFLERFFEAHERAYGYANRSAPVEIVNIRLTGLIDGLSVAPDPLAPQDGPPVPRTSRDVWFGDDGALSTAIYRRDDLGAGAALTGPAIIEQLDTTIVIHPGDRATLDAAGNLLIRIAP